MPRNVQIMYRKGRRKSMVWLSWNLVKEMKGAAIILLRPRCQGGTKPTGQASPLPPPKKKDHSVPSLTLLEVWPVELNVRGVRAVPCPRNLEMPVYMRKLSQIVNNTVLSPR